jgi:hypothetical protein
MRIRPLLWALALLLPVVGLPALAHAQAAAPATDPTDLLLQLYTFIKTAQGSLAAGAALTLVVWLLRSGLSSKWAFWQTKLGGYLLGFALPAMSYAGVALSDNQPITLSLVLSALSAGYVAAGGWEHLRDIVTAITKGQGGALVQTAAPPAPPATPAAKPPGAARLTLLTAAVLVVAPACSSAQKVEQGAVDCAKTVVEQNILANVTSIIEAGAAGWEAALEQLVVQDGEAIIECAVTDVVAVLTAPAQGSGSGSGSGSASGPSSAYGGSANAAAAQRAQDWLSKRSSKRAK